MGYVRSFVHFWSFFQNRFLLVFLPSCSQNRTYLKTDCLVVIGNGCRNQNQKGFSDGLKLSLLNRPEGVIVSGSCGGATVLSVKTALFALFSPFFVAWTCEMICLTVMISNMNVCVCFCLHLLRSGCTGFEIADDRVSLRILYVILCGYVGGLIARK